MDTVRDWTIVNIEMAQNSALTRKVRLGDVNDKSWSLESATMIMEVRPVPGHAFPIARLTTENGGLIISDAKSRVVTMVIPLSKALTMQAGAWCYDLVVTSPGIPTTRRLVGQFIVKPAVTVF